jgi:RNA polymerase sigma-70 factor, ECF subfamily
VTESTRAGHYRVLSPALGIESAPPEAPQEPVSDPPSSLQIADFAGLYQSQFGFVWRSLQRLGVNLAELDDAVQEVFVVVYRRLDSFEGRSSLRGWLFGIAVRVASQRRRTARRRPEQALPPDLPASESSDPHEATENAQARRLVYALLEELDDDKRAVFVLAELEQMTAPEIAEILQLKLNTVYSRLRAARREFEAALLAHRSRDLGSEP